MYPQIFGKYVLERELSRGGMARVLLATLRGAGGFEKKLVVKQIRDELSFDQQFVRRFVEEAKTTVALSHPNIVPVYELGVEQGTYFLAMELIEGFSVAELLLERNADRTRRVLAPEEGAYLGMEVCRALDYAHRRMNVVHRDITPRNVMLDEEGQVKLIDFGIAAPALVAGQEILGSPGHMPPEQVEGKELGPATDIFAVAVLLMEAWSGVAPFRRATPEACDEAMRGPHPRPSDYDARLLPLDDVIVRALQLDPRERQQDAADVARALRAFLQGTDVTDIARDLGSRVRALRESGFDPSPTSAHGEPRAGHANAGECGTKTFAAREEVSHWSKPPPRDLEEPPGASTRRLKDSIPPAGRVPKDVLEMLDPKRDSAPGGDTPEVDAALSNPLVMLAANPERDGRTNTTRRKKGTGELAAGSLEALVPADKSEARRVVKPTRAKPRMPLFLVIVATLCLGAGATWGLNIRASARDQRSPPTLDKGAAAASTQAAAASTSTARSVASSEVLASAPATGSSVVMLASPATAKPATAAERTVRANVSFLGDPGTRVYVDGASRGLAPVRVSLEQGAHIVRFQFDTTLESRSEHFTVIADETLTVRAEFTGASPLIRVER